MFFFFFKQKTAYEIYQCDWSSDVCSSDLGGGLYTAGSLPGSYQIIATEPSGPLADTASVIIPATPDQVPTANANGPYNGIPGSPVQFSSAGSFDPEGSWTASWDFGDGSGGTGPTPTHSYATAGSYSATLTITDQIGQTDIDVATVSVSSGQVGRASCRERV